MHFVVVKPLILSYQLRVSLFYRFKSVDLQERLVYYCLNDGMHTA